MRLDLVIGLMIGANEPIFFGNVMNGDDNNGRK